ncbi:MAG: DUF5667 domain-containing protein [Blastocatellia bacterium]|nr:DUF5667 domain-containing protein [Blastocatellia bacterium]MCS7156305.1 DUF5667 domain-containing protein [Blastocatellia bacterium]MCX7751345.1 DUF5667 domain-containing protein [Blastocatellia bacterium]MDW8169057.1 DUF5667 domain-containing protein [Acidobacteriota bacterium]MDW8256417.1 DUF5667 domain-containing protein [Acidobacteriota bacterium]
MRSRLARWIRLGALAALIALPVEGGAGPFRQGADLSALLTPEERAQFARERNPAKQVRLLLKIAENRLRDAKRLTDQESFDSALSVLLAYQALLEHAFAQIETVPPGGRRKGAYKDFDLHVRQHLKDLEPTVRAFPMSLASEAERVLKTATRLRFEALNAFAGERILTHPQPKSQ